MICLLKHNHASKSEADYCNWMLARKKAGEIPDFVYQFSIPLLIDGKSWKNWKADFAVPMVAGDRPKSLVCYGRSLLMQTMIVYNVLEVHESKGWNRSDDSFRLKLNICMRNYPDLPIYVNKVRVKFTPKGRVFIPRKFSLKEWIKEKGFKKNNRGEYERN